MRVDGALEAVAVAAVFLSCRALYAHWAGAVGAGSFADGVGLSERALDSLVLRRKKDHLGGQFRVILGRKIGVLTLELADLAIACIASRYLICIAGALLRMSAAKKIRS